MTMDERQRLARYCFGCGNINPQGLRLTFRIVDGGVEAQFTSQPEHQGFPGVMHGNLVATLLDEAMSWALVAADVWAVTARMETRFRQPVPLGEPLRVTGRIIKDRRRLLTVAAELNSQDGQVLAHGEGLFMRVAPERERQLKDIYLGSGVKWNQLASGEIMASRGLGKKAE